MARVDLLTKQHLDQFLVAAQRREVERVLALVVERLLVRPKVDELPGNLPVPLLAREVQRCDAVHGLHGCLGAGRDQEPDGVELTGVRGEVQRGSLVPVRPVHVRARGDALTESIHVTRAGGAVQVHLVAHLCASKCGGLGSGFGFVLFVKKYLFV